MVECNTCCGYGASKTVSGGGLIRDYLIGVECSECKTSAEDVIIFADFNESARTIALILEDQGYWPSINWVANRKREIIDFLNDAIRRKAITCEATGCLAFPWLRYGHFLCDAHARRFRKYGDPRGPAKNCITCGVRFIAEFYGGQVYCSNECSHNNGQQNRRERKSGCDGLYEDLTHLPKICTYCNTDNGKFHQDHVYPLAKNDGTVKSYLVWACAPCNLSKGASLPSSVQMERVLRLADSCRV